MIYDDRWIGTHSSLVNKTFEYKADLFNNCRMPNENLYIGNLDISLIDSQYNLFPSLKNIFDSKLYELLKDCKSIDDLQKNNVLYFFTKICYLSEVFKLKKQFNHPIMVYYNPRTGKNICHPGLGRLEVQRLFNCSSIHCFFYNTRAVGLETIGIINTQNFKKINLIEILNLGHEFLLGFSFDHGSIIPQIHFHDKEILSRFFYINQIYEKIKNLKIKSNIDIPFLKTFYHINHNVEFVFNQSYSERDIARAVIFSIIGHNYCSENLKIINLN